MDLPVGFGVVFLVVAAVFGAVVVGEVVLPVGAGVTAATDGRALVGFPLNRKIVLINKLHNHLSSTL